MDDEDSLDATFFALSSVHRRRMLDVIAQQPGCNLNRVCAEFEQQIGRFAVMKHLQVLERGGLVHSERVGRERLMWFDATPIQWVHQRWTTTYSAFWAAKLTRLKVVAEGAQIKTLPLVRRPRKEPHG